MTTPHATRPGTEPSPESSSPDGDYDVPENYENLTEVTRSSVGGPYESNKPERAGASSAAATPKDMRPEPEPTESKSTDGDYDIPENYENLSEVTCSSVGESYVRTEPERAGDLRNDRNAAPVPSAHEDHVSTRATQVYTISYLILFSFFGTLARLGLAALTSYPGAPIIFSDIWANVGGCVVMGFLAEDRILFRHEWGRLPRESSHKIDDVALPSGASASDHELAAIKRAENERAASKKAHLAVKKTIPLYIGLATGFCGSFTSFSTFIKDSFLAVSNDLAMPGAPNVHVSRNGGYSFMASLAVIVGTVALSLSALFFGAHVALATQSFLSSLPYRTTRKVIDPLAVFLAWGCWLGAVLLSIFPPHGYWRSRATFALVFAPLGCLLRFYLALYLNGRRAAFPMGTFAANILGTVLLGMAWDIAHVQAGGVVGCQILQGIEDGFCGCLSTISTWATELSGLRKQHAYLYGLVSVVAALALLIVIMGGLRWTHGFDALLCS